jgi:hypothetical protein
MRETLTIFVVSVLIIGCKPKLKTENFILPRAQDINNVAKASLLTKDSMPLEKCYHRGQWEYYESETKIIENFNDHLILDLKNITVYVPSDEVNFPNRFRNYISINELLNNEYRGSKLFTSIDSTFILFQSDSSKKFSIDTNSIEEYIFVSNKTLMEDQKIGKTYGYIILSIPIFSKDLNKAYIEVDHYCGEGLCGGGYFLFLERKKEQWKIIARQSIWIS